MEAAMACLLQAQVQQVQSMAALQGTFNRLAENLTPRTPHALPTALLTKQTPRDNAEAFLEVIERTAEREDWSEDMWAHNRVVMGRCIRALPFDARTTQCPWTC
ncbi:uncharacterized protein ACO6RY_07595 [Pungitius sinensis]